MELTFLVTRRVSLLWPGLDGWRQWGSLHTQTADLNSIETRSSLIVSLVGTISNGVCLFCSTLGSIKTKILFLNKQEV